MGQRAHVRCGYCRYIAGFLREGNILTSACVNEPTQQRGNMEGSVELELWSVAGTRIGTSLAKGQHVACPLGHQEVLQPWEQWSTLGALTNEGRDCLAKWRGVGCPEMKLKA